MNEKTPDESIQSLSYDASNEEDIQRAKSAAGRRKKAEADVIRKIMHTPECRAWIYSWLDVCHIFTTSFVKGQLDVVAFHEGERNVGLRLMSAVTNASVDLYITMMKEHRQND